MRLPRLFRKKSLGKRKNPVKKIITGFLFIPTCFILAMIIMFFAFDDFTILFLSGVHNTGTGDGNYSQYDYIPEGWDRPFPTDEWQGSVPSSQLTGVAGAAAMYINQMSEGYYKEYLQVIKGHCDWTYMQGSVAPLKLNGVDTYPPLYMYLGLQLSEGGAEQSADSASGRRIATLSTMKGSAWNNDGKHTIATYNSTVIKEENGASLPSSYYSIDLYTKRTPTEKNPLTYTKPYITHFQIHEGNFPVTPTGRKSEPGGYYPSKLNGYGIAEGTVRTLNDVDAGYYPDVISVAIQRSYLSTAKMGKSNIDFDALTPGAVINLAYANYAYGESGAKGPWGVGYHGDDGVFTSGGWNSRNTVSFGTTYARGMNWMDTQINKLLDALCKDFEGYIAGEWGDSIADMLTENGPINHSDYRGMAFFTVLYNGGFTIERYKDSILSGDLNDKGFLRGSTIAYRAFTGNKALTEEDTKKWYKEKMPVKDISTTYPGHAGRSADDVYVFYIDPNTTIISNDGSMTVNALHSYSASLRGLFMWRVGGVVEYYRILFYSGIECTFADAWLDANGKKFIPETYTGTPGPSGSYYWGTERFGNWRNADDGSKLVNLTTMSSAMHNRYLVWDGGSSIGIHYGEDYGCPSGVPFIAMAPGKVIYAKWIDGAGYRIRIQVMTEQDSKENIPKIEYEYQHCSAFESQTGDIVKVGDVVAYCGSTGDSTGAHMHLNLRVYRGTDGNNYCLPFRAIYEGKCSVYNAPAVVAGVKADPGYVYGIDMSAPLGSFKDNTDSDRAINRTEKSQNGYYKMGLMKFLDQALAQARTYGR